MEIKSMKKETLVLGVLVLIGLIGVITFQTGILSDPIVPQLGLSLAIISIVLGVIVMHLTG